MTPPAITSGRRQRSVLVVDDSAFMRKLIAEMVDANPQFKVVGVARDGEDALEQVGRIDPDIITLDLEMPRLDGMQVLERIMREAPRPVVVLSAGGPQFGDATLRALELGAVDFVQKPSGPISLDLGRIRDRLATALSAAARSRKLLMPPAPATDRSYEGIGIPRVGAAHPGPASHIVVIASSTGGPRALAEVIPALPGNLGAAVVVAQHLPLDFTAALAQRLDRLAQLPVHLAASGVALEAGRVYIAPGGANTVVSGVPGAATLDVQHTGLRRSGGIPSADVLFHSAAQMFRGCVTGVVLTGMGRDGSAGLREIRRLGGKAIVQDQGSSAIYGMPRAALATAGADRVVALADVAATIVETVPGEYLAWLMV